MSADVNETARRLADALERAQVPYALGGAIAYGYFGAARGTKDVDVKSSCPPSVRRPRSRFSSVRGLSWICRVRWRALPSGVM